MSITHTTNEIVHPIVWNQNEDHKDFAYQNTTFTINLKQTKVNYMFFSSNLCLKITW
jgi:hypothetical protein